MYCLGNTGGITPKATRGFASRWDLCLQIICFQKSHFFTAGSPLLSFLRLVFTEIGLKIIYFILIVNSHVYLNFFRLSNYEETYFYASLFLTSGHATEDNPVSYSAWAMLGHTTVYKLFKVCICKNLKNLIAPIFQKKP